MLADVVFQVLGLLGLELLFGSDGGELSPSKAISTERMTELTLQSVS